MDAEFQEILDQMEQATAELFAAFEAEVERLTAIADALTKEAGRMLR